MVAATSREVGKCKFLRSQPSHHNPQKCHFLQITWPWIFVGTPSPVEFMISPRPEGKVWEGICHIVPVPLRPPPPRFSGLVATPPRTATAVVIDSAAAATSARNEILQHSWENRSDVAPTLQLQEDGIKGEGHRKPGFPKQPQKRRIYTPVQVHDPQLRHIIDNFFSRCGYVIPPCT